MARQYVGPGILFVETGARQWNAEGIQFLDPNSSGSPYSLSATVTTYTLTRFSAGLQDTQHLLLITSASYTLTRPTTALAAKRKLSLTWKHYHASDGWYNWNSSFGSSTDYTLGGSASIVQNVYVGQTLYATPGQWDQSVSLSYQWYQDGVTPISGATGTNYTPVAGDLNHYISFNETATALDNSTTSKMSNLVGPVQSTSSGTNSTLSAPVLGYPNPNSGNPTTIPVSLKADWQSGHTLVMLYSANPTISAPVRLTHVLTDADADANGFTLPIPTLSSATYFQAFGNDGTGDSSNVSNIVAWGDTAPPIINTPATYSITETLQLALPLTSNEPIPANGWAIDSGPDQLQFQIIGTNLCWIGNGTQRFGTSADTNALDQGLDNTYSVVISATDFANNKTLKSITVTVLQADLDSDPFSFTSVTNATRSTLYTAVDTAAITGLSAGVNAPASVNIGEYRVDPGTGVYGPWTAAGSFSVQNNYKVQLRQTSSAQYLTPTTQTLTVGKTTGSFVVTTVADPNAAAFNPSSTQPISHNYNNTSASATYTADFQAGFPVVFVPSPSGGKSVVSVTVNGLAATLRTPGASGGGGVFVCTAAVAAGTYSVVVNYNGVIQMVSALTGTLINSSNPVPTGWVEGGFTFSSAVTATSALTVPNQGFGVAFVEEQSPTSSPVAATGLLIKTGMVGMAGGTNPNGGISRQTTAGSWIPSFSMSAGDSNYMHLIGVTFGAT